MRLLVSEQGRLQPGAAESIIASRAKPTLKSGLCRNGLDLRDPAHMPACIKVTRISIAPSALAYAGSHGGFIFFRSLTTCDQTPTYRRVCDVLAVRACIAYTTANSATNTTRDRALLVNFDDFPECWMNRCVATKRISNTPCKREQHKA